MNGRVVERILGSRYTQESRTLLEGRRSQARHLLKLGPAGEGSIILAIVDDILRENRSESADVHKQMLRGGIEIHSNIIHAALYRKIKRVLEFRLVYIMLILAYTDTLGVDFHQFGKRVHKPAAYRDSTTNGDILIRKLLTGYLRGGVDGGSVFADGKDLRRCYFMLRRSDVVAAGEDITDKVVGLARGCAVADRDGLYLIFPDHLLDGHRRLHAFVDRRVGEDGLVAEEVALGIETYHLTTRTESGVDAHHTFLA